MNLNPTTTESFTSKISKNTPDRMRLPEPSKSLLKEVQAYGRLIGLDPKKIDSVFACQLPDLLESNPTWTIKQWKALLSEVSSYA